MHFISTNLWHCIVTFSLFLVGWRARPALVVVLACLGWPQFWGCWWRLATLPSSLQLLIFLPLTIFPHLGGMFCWFFWLRLSSAKWMIQKTCFNQSFKTNGGFSLKYCFMISGKQRQLAVPVSRWHDMPPSHLFAFRRSPLSSGVIPCKHWHDRADAASTLALSGD